MNLPKTSTETEDSLHLALDLLSGIVCVGPDMVESYRRENYECKRTEAMNKT
jgi:hypothetical protein